MEQLKTKQERLVTSPLLDIKQAADYVGLKVRTLYNMKQTGRGPKCIKMGRLVKYRIVDLDKWIDSQSFDPAA